MTPDSAATVQQLLAFYLEAGVDCALAEVPVNRLSDPDIDPAPRGSPRTRGGDPVGARGGADRADARGAAPAPGKFRRLRAEIDRHPPGIRRRQPAGAHHVRRRGPRPRGRHRGTAIRWTFGQA